MAAEITFSAASGFLGGVLLVSFGWTAPQIVLLSLAVFALTLLLFKDKKVFVLVGATAAIAGLFYYHFFLNVRIARERIPEGEEISFSALVTEEPRTSGEWRSFRAKLVLPLRGEIVVVTKTSRTLEYGDLLAIDDTAIETRDTKESLPVAFPKEVRVIAHDQGSKVKTTLIGFKRRLLAQFERALPRDASALLGGLTFGSKREFSEELREDMARSGTSHLVALSGYNIAIITLAVARTLTPWLGRKLTFYATALVIALFVMMVGGESSIVRAAIMGFLLLLAKKSGRVYTPRNVIAAAALLMTLHDPTVIRFDPGFQLSFVSLLGIVYLEPALRAREKKREHEGFLSWKENVRTTLSAQLAVAPLIINYFDQFSLTSIFANVLILGAVPLTMFIGFLMAFAGALSSFLSMILGWLVYPLLAYELGIIRFFSEFMVPLRVDSSLLALLYYGTLLGVIIYHYDRKKA